MNTQHQPTGPNGASPTGSDQSPRNALGADGPVIDPAASTDSQRAAPASEAGQPVQQPTRNGKLKSLLWLGLAVIVLPTTAAIAMIWYKNQHRPDYDQAAHGPDINFAETLPTDDAQTDPGAVDAVLRGSITDWLVRHPPELAEHPLDPAIKVARDGLDYFRHHVRDYTATVVKQERLAPDQRLLPEEFIKAKVRNERVIDGKQIPLSFYMKTIKPKSAAGREVIWVNGRDNGKLIAHEGGILGLVTVKLDPEHRLARVNNRYPITEFGLENLMIRLIEKGESGRQLNDCRVAVDRSVEIDGHACTLITIEHEQQHPGLDYHQAKIYIDDELNVPIGYQGYWWPEEPGGDPRLLESYFYTELRLNVGLAEIDFDTANPEYKFR